MSYCDHLLDPFRAGHIFKIDTVNQKQKEKLLQIGSEHCF